MTYADEATDGGGGGDDGCCAAHRQRRHHCWTMRRLGLPPPRPPSLRFRRTNCQHRRRRQLQLRQQRCSTTGCMRLWDKAAAFGEHRASRRLRHFHRQTNCALWCWHLEWTPLRERFDSVEPPSSHRTKNRKMLVDHSKILLFKFIEINSDFSWGKILLGNCSSPICRFLILKHNKRKVFSNFRLFVKRPFNFFDLSELTEMLSQFLFWMYFCKFTLFNMQLNLESRPAIRPQISSYSEEQFPINFSLSQKICFFYHVSHFSRLGRLYLTLFSFDCLFTLNEWSE